MDVTMPYLGAIIFVVKIVWREGQVLFAKNRWLIHVIPEWIQIICTFKHFWLHEVLPEGLSIFIQKVNPAAFTGPGSTSVSIPTGISHKNISNISVSILGDIVLYMLLLFDGLISLLQIQTCTIDVVALINFDMRISNQDQTSLAFANLCVHSLNIRSREGEWIEFEISVFVSMINIKPQNVYLKALVWELVVPFNDLLSRVSWIPFAEVETQRPCWR